MNGKRTSHFLGIMLLLSLLIVPATPARAGIDALAGTGLLTKNGSLYWNTFLGGSQFEWAKGIAVDGNGNAYITGRSYSSWGNPVNAYAGGAGDAFVARLDPNGALVWNTFLGGTSWDEARSVAVDAGGNVYIIGVSPQSWGSPVNGHAGETDAFVAKLDSSGAPVWNTFLGCSNWDDGWGIAVDGSGNVRVSGVSTESWGSPVNSFAGGTGDAFVASLDGNGSLVWNTFLGGSDWDTGRDITLDGSGNIYLTGSSSAGWGSPVRAFTGKQAALVARLDRNGTLTWNTFLGGTTASNGYGIAVNEDGNVYVSGGSGDNWGSPVNPLAGYYDAFAARLDAGGGLVWNTFLGGSMFDEGYEIALDGDGNATIVGDSDASWGTPIRPFAGDMDAFIAGLDSSGARAWNTFLGGSANDSASSIAIDGRANIYVTGRAPASWGTPVRAFSGLSDAFVARLGMAGGFRSTGKLDGWVLESHETSMKGGSKNATGGAFLLGDDALDRQYRSILSFNTAGLPDAAVVTKVTLKIKRQGIAGTDPFNTHMGLRADIRKPYFGAGEGLAIADFQAGAGSSTAGTFNKTPTVAGWYMAVLDPAAIPQVNLAGLTQFRLRFALDDNDNREADYLRFYSGNASTISNRPVLVVEYYVP